MFCTICGRPVAATDAKVARPGLLAHANCAEVQARPGARVVQNDPVTCALIVDGTTLHTVTRLDLLDGDAA